MNTQSINDEFGAKGVGGGGQKILALGQWRPKPGLIVGCGDSGSKASRHPSKKRLSKHGKSFCNRKKVDFFLKIAIVSQFWL